MADTNVNPEAIDSRAQNGKKVPDPELHQDTISGALAEHRTILALFSTPVYCQSEFCGPSTDALEQIAKAGPADAAYIHIEIYKDYANNQVNTAAKQWLLRNGNLTEPWLFLIGPDGKIVDRWSPLFDVHEVQAELDRVAR
jgi:endo-alpha-1,4-polygalactosaminidase (GH114 family)